MDWIGQIMLGIEHITLSTRALPDQCRPHDFVGSYQTSIVLQLKAKRISHRKNQFPNEVSLWRPVQLDEIASRVFCCQ